MTLVLFLAATAVAIPPAAARAATPIECRSGIPAGAADSLSDLPLKVVRPSPGDSAPELAVFLTGDGGWAAIDKEISDSLARRGIPVVALNSREYLANRRTPERVASDVARIIRYYGRSFGKSVVLLIGYSRGADILPFVANRLPRDIRSQVRLIALLGLAPNANFKFHLIDLITNHHRPDDLPTLPEVRRLRGAHILCFYGVEEKEAACRSLAHSVATVVGMPNGHHFGGRYGEIATRILDALGSTVTTSSP
jgi:type IV secretory pathway VirJ component